MIYFAHGDGHEHMEHVTNNNQGDVMLYVTILAVLVVVGIAIYVALSNSASTSSKVPSKKKHKK